MRKLVLAAAVVAMSVQPAFASWDLSPEAAAWIDQQTIENPSDDFNNDNNVDQNDEGQVSSSEDADTYAPPRRPPGRPNPPRPNPPRPNPPRPHPPRPPRPHPPRPYPPYPPIGYEYACYAQNARGSIFQAIGYNRSLTQQRALDRCYRVSQSCRPLGCRVY